MNAASYPTMRYDCDQLCDKYEHIKSAYGHDSDAVGMPEGACHELGPWTDDFKLRRCPTHVLGDRIEIIDMIEHHKAVKSGIPFDSRGSDLWPNIMWEIYWFVERCMTKGDAWLSELKRQEAKQKKS